MKDKLNKLSKSNVAYQFSCPGCEPSYTARTLFKRTKKYEVLQTQLLKDTLIIAQTCSIYLPFTINNVNMY